MPQLKLEKKMHLKAVVIFFLLIMFPNTVLCADVETVLMEVEKNMSNIKTVQASFIQKKNMVMFDMPVIIKGEFKIQNPDNFSWTVLEPVEYKLIITKENIIKWEKSTGTQKMSLKENPMFKEMISQITFWFSGAYATCTKDYTVKLIKTSPAVLNFIPKEHNPVSNMLTGVTLTFQDNKKYINKIQLFEKNGDSTELLFNNVKINSEIKNSAWRIE